MLGIATWWQAGTQVSLMQIQVKVTKTRIRHCIPMSYFLNG